MCPRHTGFYVLSCDLHSAILWKTERERETQHAYKPRLSELAEVRQPEFYTLPNKSPTFQRGAISKGHVLTNGGGWECC